MKNILMVVVCISSLWACHNEQQSQKEKAETEHARHDGAHTDLRLNNGAKWKADESTNRNLAQMDSVVVRYQQKAPKTLADYTMAASELQHWVDNMISECRMSGADHDALHQWLQPVLERVNQLKKATDGQQASQVFNQISDDVKNYHEYFE